VSKTHENTPTSHVRLGYARRDVTPPVGIYHRMWGAARHDRATGIHRPILADILVFEPLNGDADQRLVRMQFDFVGLTNEQQNPIRIALAERASVQVDRLIVTYSHSHASGFLHPDRKDMPGGDLIEPYLESLTETLEKALDEALQNLAPVSISYATGRCNMAANRDYRDEARDIYVTGYNPEAPADDIVVAARVTDEHGAHHLSFVHYACHPTTLAWENTVLSPDFVGATREVVEHATACPCVYFQGPCGELGPKDGFTGDLATADRNGRQLGYAAMSALSSLGPPDTDYVYEGPVVSGATLGIWRHHPMSDDRRRHAGTYHEAAFDVDLKLKDLPALEQLQSDLERYSEEQKQADQAGDAERARDLGARAERCRRWQGRVENLPQTEQFALRCTVWRMGDAIWVTCGGEPYNQLQTKLRERFPDLILLVSPLSTDCLSIAYLLPEDRYGIGLYQEEPSSLAPGCLEVLIENFAEQIGCALEA